MYTHYKTNLTTESYVDVLDIAKFRKCFASFRCSVHNLSIETGRHYGIQREERTCPYCECYIEDEFHFLLICPLYTVIRNVYIAKYYREYPTLDKFYSLMSSTNTLIIRNVAMFIYYAFEERKYFMNV